MEGFRKVQRPSTDVLEITASIQTRPTLGTPVSSGGGYRKRGSIRCLPLEPPVQGGEGVWERGSKGRPKILFNLPQAHLYRQSEISSASLAFLYQSLLAQGHATAVGASHYSLCVCSAIAVLHAGTPAGSKRFVCCLSTHLCFFYHKKALSRLMVICSDSLTA